MGAGFAQRDAAGILSASAADSAADCADHPASVARDGGRDAGTSAGCPPRVKGSLAPTQATTDFLESVRLLAAGGVAGAVSKTATAPLARLTILYQVGNPRSICCMHLQPLGPRPATGATGLTRAYPHKAPASRLHAHGAELLMHAGEWPGCGCGLYRPHRPLAGVPTGVQCLPMPLSCMHHTS